MTPVREQDLLTAKSKVADLSRSIIGPTDVRLCNIIKFMSGGKAGHVPSNSHEALPTVKIVRSGDVRNLHIDKV